MLTSRSSRCKEAFSRLSHCVKLRCNIPSRRRKPPRRSVRKIDLEAWQLQLWRVRNPPRILRARFLEIPRYWPISLGASLRGYYMIAKIGFQDINMDYFEAAMPRCNRCIFLLDTLNARFMPSLVIIKHIASHIRDKYQMCNCSLVRLPVTRQANL